MKCQLLLIVKEPGAIISVEENTDTVLTVVTDVEVALEKLHQFAFDAILYDDLLEIMEENKLQKISGLIHEGIMLARKEPAESWQFCIGKVREALKYLRKKKVLITDDALKNAQLNICLN